MNIAIKNISSATNAEWDHIWHGCDYSTFFHSREWAEIWENYTNGQMRHDPKLVIFTDGKKALLPLSYYRELKGLIKNYISSPAGTFGGWISEDELVTKHGFLLIELLTKRLGNLVWRINPYDDLVIKSGVQGSEQDETRVLNLEGGFDVIYKKWSKGHSSAVRKARKARKEGVTVRLAETINDWRDYYSIYEDSLRRWGDKTSSCYKWELFGRFFFCRSNNVRLWLAVFDEQVVAGALCFYAKKHVVYWHGAALEKYFRHRPVNLLMYEAIKSACEEGYSWFDFNPSGGHEGVKAFKRSFRAESLPCPVVTVQTRTMLFLNKIRAILKKHH